MDDSFPGERSSFNTSICWQLDELGFDPPLALLECISFLGAGGYICECVPKTLSSTQRDFFTCARKPVTIGQDNWRVLLRTSTTTVISRYQLSRLCPCSSPIDSLYNICLPCRNGSSRLVEDVEMSWSTLRIRKKRYWIPMYDITASCNDTRRGPASVCALCEPTGASSIPSLWMSMKAYHIFTSEVPSFVPPNHVTYSTPQAACMVEQCTSGCLGSSLNRYSRCILGVVMVNLC